MQVAGLTGVGETAFRERDLTYIQDSTNQRNELVEEIRDALDAASFHGQPLDEQEAKNWIDQAASLLDQASSLANP